jgi:hypothetical protein
MSLLTKIFIVLVFMASLVSLGVQATLFAMRVDFKDKWVKEANHHYNTIAMKNNEISHVRVEKENREDYARALNRRIEVLVTETAKDQTMIATLDRMYSLAQLEKTQLLTDLDSFTKQLEVQLTRIKEQEVKLTELRDRLGKMIVEKNASLQQLVYVQQDLDRVSKELASLEERHVEVVKSARNKDEILEYLSANNVNIRLGAMQTALIEGKVMSASPQAGVVLINQGKDARVLVGMEFTIFRGNQFVAKGVVRSADRDWAALSIEIKHLEPQVGDDVSNRIGVSGVVRPPSK